MYRSVTQRSESMRAAIRLHGNCRSSVVARGVRLCHLSESSPILASVPQTTITSSAKLTDAERLPLFSPFD